MRKNKVQVISLGCSKNLVDSEHLLRQLQVAGYTIEHNPKRIDAEVVVVNTCGFIADAQEESINTILELGEAKRSGRIGKLYVMGCLAERFMADLVAELPEVDKFYGKFTWPQLLADLGKGYRDDLAGERYLTTPRHYAYLKISEGCNRFCATGTAKSSPWRGFCISSTRRGLTRCCCLPSGIFCYSKGEPRCWKLNIFPFR